MGEEREKEKDRSAYIHPRVLLLLSLLFHEFKLQRQAAHTRQIVRMYVCVTDTAKCVCELHTNVAAARNYDNMRMNIAI